MSMRNAPPPSPLRKGTQWRWWQWRWRWRRQRKIAISFINYCCCCWFWVFLRERKNYKCFWCHATPCHSTYADATLKFFSRSLGFHFTTAATVVVVATADNDHRYYIIINFHMRISVRLHRFYCSHCCCCCCVSFYVAIITFAAMMRCWIRGEKTLNNIPVSGGGLT